MPEGFNDLILLNKSYIKSASELLARSFQDDPVPAYFFPDEAERRKKAPYIYQFLLSYGIRYGEAYATSEGLEGVAVWLPSGNVDISLWRILRSGAFFTMFHLGRESGQRMRYFSEYMDEVHKGHISMNHWYLQIMGVEPLFQGEGYASKLLRAMFSRLDMEDVPCYLETQTERNVAMYEHFEFKVLEKFTIPSTSFSNWAMLR